jgi:hypothetical protein
VTTPPIDGPSTLITANTALNRLRYFARSRTATRSPTTAWAPTASPPPPNPCTARKAISSVIDRLSPHSAEPPMKIPIAISIHRLRPRRSPSRPQTGVAMVEATR